MDYINSTLRARAQTTIVDFNGQYRYVRVPIGTLLGISYEEAEKKMKDIRTSNPDLSILGRLTFNI